MQAALWVWNELSTHVTAECNGIDPIFFFYFIVLRILSMKLSLLTDF